jgi:hypothetical protein
LYCLHIEKLKHRVLRRETKIGALATDEPQGWFKKRMKKDRNKAVFFIYNCQVCLLQGGEIISTFGRPDSINDEKKNFGTQHSLYACSQASPFTGV